MKKLAFGGVLLGFVLIVLIVSVLLYRSFSSDKSLSEGLFLHLDQILWKEIKILSSNLDMPIYLQYQKSPIRVCSLQHGVYTVSLQLHNGETAWTEFLHHDARVRKRVDIYIEYNVEQNSLQFTQIYNQTIELFKGHTKISDTSEESPFRLDWI